MPPFMSDEPAHPDFPTHPETRTGKEREKEYALLLSRVKEKNMHEMFSPKLVILVDLQPKYKLPRLLIYLKPYI